MSSIEFVQFDLITLVYVQNLGKIRPVVVEIFQFQTAIYAMGGWVGVAEVIMYVAEDALGLK